MLHKNVVYSDNHIVHSWEVADEAARLALSLVATDVGRIARQLDTGEFFLLVDDTPATWIAISNSQANNLVTTLTSGVVLVANKLITTDSTGAAIYADAATLTHAGRLVGIALQSASSIGLPIQVATEGLVTNAGWAWTPGQVLYVGLSGDITASQEGLYSTSIGYARTATSIILNIGSTIIRS